MMELCPALVDLLSGNIPHTVDAGVTPEEYTGVIRRLNPSVIVFLDAADFGAEPGQMKIIMPEEVSEVRISIHKDLTRDSHGISEVRDWSECLHSWYSAC